MHGARCLIFCRTLRLLPYFMCANSEGSGETARMRRLAWAFAGRLCDKYHYLMIWLNCFIGFALPCMDVLIFLNPILMVIVFPIQQVHLSLLQEQPPPTSGSSGARTVSAIKEFILLVSFPSIGKYPLTWVSYSTHTAKWTIASLYIGWFHL